MLSDAEWWEDRSGQCVEEFCRVVGRHNKHILSIYPRVLYEPLLRTHDLTRGKRRLPKLASMETIIADANDLLLYAVILRVTAKKGFETGTKLKDWVQKKGDKVLERVGLKVQQNPSKHASRWGNYDSVFCGKDFTPGSEDFIKIFRSRTQQWKFSNMYVKEQNETAIDLMVVNPAARVIITDLRLQLQNTKLELETYRHDTDLGTVAEPDDDTVADGSDSISIGTVSDESDDGSAADESDDTIGIVEDSSSDEAGSDSDDGSAADEADDTIGIVEDSSSDEAGSEAEDGSASDEADDDEAGSDSISIGPVSDEADDDTVLEENLRTRT